MCTLSFVPRESGYAVAMNRDEQFARACGLPPEVFGNAIYPHEPNGGTWIAVNTAGLTLAVLNKNQDGPLPAKIRSRGELIAALITSESLAEVHRRLLEFGFKGIWPFRLIAVSFEERELCEWAYGTQLVKAHYDWERRHWYSSGMSDREAANTRSIAGEQASHDEDVGTMEWLRRLHKSHFPKPGAFSICVHREDAATVSYSEIVFEHGQATMRYAAGSPCQSIAFDSVIALPARRTAPQFSF